MQAKSWLNGSHKALPNGTCGHVIHVATPITPITIIALLRAWRFMATNMPCISHGIHGLRDATKNCHPHMRRSSPKAAKWVPTMDGNAQIGSHNLVTTRPKKPLKPGAVPVHGNSASAKNAKPFVTQLVYWIYQDFHVTGYKVRARLSFCVVYAQVGSPRSGASDYCILPTNAAVL